MWLRGLRPGAGYHEKMILNSDHALDWAVIGWLTVPNTRVLWTTSSRVTAGIAWERIRYILLDRSVVLLLPVDRFIALNGGEEIRFQNGSRVLFRTRGSQAGRGITADKLILDEALELTDLQLGALLPAASASGAELVYSQTEVPGD